MDRDDKEAFELSNTTEPFEPASAGIAALSQAMLVSLGQCQAEAAGLATRRTRAWMELSDALGACRSVPDVTRLQTEFVGRLWTDWFGAGQRMAEAWSRALVPVAGTMTLPKREASPTAADPPSDPVAVWEWWRTDMKAIVPRHSEPASRSAGRNGTH